MSVNNEINKVLRSSEASGFNSASANEIIKVLRPIYQAGNKEQVIEKIEQLKKEPGIPFPTNYRDILEQD